MKVVIHPTLTWQLKRPQCAPHKSCSNLIGASALDCTSAVRCSESHRSSHSVDDNAIDPLNEAETQSCSSAGSNDWRLDLRGNNLDCSPPPPITDDVIDAILIERNNQLNCEGKFNDSSSDRSSSNNTTKDTNGHFNRLIMSDSVYGKVYETRRMPNGLETTEV